MMSSASLISPGRRPSIAEARGYYSREDVLNEILQAMQRWHVRFVPGYARSEWVYTKDPQELHALIKKPLDLMEEHSERMTRLVNNIVGVTNLHLSVEAMRIGKEYGMDLHRLAAIMETSSGRNFFTNDWDRGKATFGYFAKSLDLVKVAVDLSRKDLQHAQELAKQVGLACPLLDQIVDAVTRFTYEEIKERWGSVT